MSIVDDTSPTTHAQPASSSGQEGLMSGLSPRVKVLMVAFMPLFLIVVFILCFVSAGHAPTPYRLPIVISGSDQLTSQISEKLVEATDEKAFTITTTSSAEEAENAVATRAAAGAVAIGDTSVTTYFATGGGAFQAGIIRSVGTQIAGELKLPVTLTDVAPTAPEDPAGTSLLFFLIVCTLGSFLSVTVMIMGNSKGRIAGQLATVGGASILAPLIGFLLISSFTGGLDRPFGTTAAVIGIGMLYSAIIGLLTVTLARIAGLGGILISMLLVIATNFPSSGASAAEATLPPFWQLVHNLWPGSAMVEWVRGITYFDGAQVDRWSAQLLTWGVIAVVALIVVVLLQKRGPAVSARLRARRASDDAQDRPTLAPRRTRSLTVGPEDAETAG